MARKKTRLNKAEVNELITVYNRLCALHEKYYNNDLQLQIECNGTVAENIGGAVASIETIIQEYL